MADELTIKPPEAMIPRQTGILWGPAKVGKTTLLCSMPGKKLLVNIDPDGYGAVGYRDDVSVLDLAKLPEHEIMEKAKDKVPTMIRNACEAGDFKAGDTTVVDSLSSYGWAALLTAIKNGVGKSPTFTPSIEAPGLSAYGARTNYIVSMVRNILKVTGQYGLHCWFTAHMDTPTTNAKGDFLYQTMTLSDNGVNQTSLSISEVWFMDRNDKKQTIAIQPCRGRKPMGSRMFDMNSDAEFENKFDIDAGDDQAYSMSTWWRMYLHNDKKKLPLPGTPAFMKLYKELA